MATVAVGISGGVDSSVAALLLRQQGHDVIGVHMTNWDPLEEGDVGCAEREALDAQKVCSQLGIGYHGVSFVREYWQDVFEPFIEGYQRGVTPNPDIACNRYIKFDRFVQHTRGLGADWVATGHYARLRRSGGEAVGDAPVELLKGVDSGKDQSYFLSMVRQEALRRTLFPLGGFCKADVRKLAAEAGLHTAVKRDSVGICFVGKRDFGEFIAAYVETAVGAFVCVESGAVIGQHGGHVRFTPGQRARIGGRAERWYVAAKDAPSNTVFVCRGARHPALLTVKAETDTPSWVAGEAPSSLRSSGLRCDVRVRHLKPVVSCTTQPTGVGLRVMFEEPTLHVAEQQTLVLYDGEVCLGGASVKARLTGLPTVVGAQPAV